MDYLPEVEFAVAQDFSRLRSEDPTGLVLTPELATAHRRVLVQLHKLFMGMALKSADQTANIS
jgi:hypothetical protein